MIDKAQAIIDYIDAAIKLALEEYEYDGGSLSTTIETRDIFENKLKGVFK